MAQSGASIVCHSRNAFSHDRSLAVRLVFAPKTGRAVDVYEDVIFAVGDIDGQAAGFDTDEILIERIGLENVESLPIFGVLQSVAAAGRIDSGGRDRRKAIHHGAGAGAEVKRIEAFEGHVLGGKIAFETDIIQEERMRSGPDNKSKDSDAAQDKRVAGTRLLSDVQLVQRNDERTGAGRYNSVVVDTGPITRGGGIVDFHRNREGLSSFEEGNGFQEVVSVPILRSAHYGVVFVDAERVCAIGRVRGDDIAALERVAALKGSAE